MGDRGNCKVFAPNYFNPTKCQNCFKQKEQHPSQEQLAANGKPTGKSSTLGKNVAPPRTLLKESVLLKSSLGREPVPSENLEWDRHWFALYSNGELQEYEIVDGQINKDNVASSVMLQDFIRMLDGKVELNEKLCFGIKTLRETIYFKTTTKVDYENWWKEISTFVAAPLKRSTSTNVTTGSKSNLVGGINRPALCKQLSVPISSISPARSSRSSSISSLQSEPEHPAMEGLRTQISKLEDENSKLSKAEEERRKLELEVNYWKEYVTNAQMIKKSGGSTDTVTELRDARSQIIQLQDELNQSQKKLKSNSGKLLMRNKEVAGCKDKLREANSIIAVYKAKIDQLTKEISNRNELIDDACAEATMKNEEYQAERKRSEGDCLDAGARVVSPDAQHLEDKFLLLKDKLKRIERELLIKSKELEKANESRSKVAKYTRSLLQELETRLRDNQHKLTDTEEKLKNANIELSMERERRIKLEEGPRRRMSNIVSPPKPTSHIDSYTNSPAVDLTEHDVDTKYADYYRSRFKEAESSLFEKDRKLVQAEEKLKEIQNSMKHNSDTYKVINEMQIKLSDATHKLSDRQLKIHELTCEVDRLKKFEKTYDKKRQQCGTLEDIVKDLETQNSDLSKNLFQVKQELGMLKIREVVLKEQLQTFCDDSEESDDSDDDSKLGRSVELKNKIEKMIDLESRCQKYALDNEELTKKNAEFETRLRQLNMANFKSLEATKEHSVVGLDSNKVQELNEKRIKELEQSLAAEEEKFCNQLSSVKEKFMTEISTLEKNSEKERESAKNELEKAKSEIDKLLSQKGELEKLIEQLSEKVNNSTSNTDVPDSKPKNEEKLVEDISKPVSKSESVSSKESGGSGSSSIKDRDSGIVITQEIKCLIDAAKNNNIEILLCDDEFSMSQDSVSEIDIIEKYKLVCSKFQIKMKELTSKYVASEEKCIELAQTLERHNTAEQTIALEYDILLGRFEELESQIVESQELLHSKADELEKERKNVIHLVEATSAYITELESSIEESKIKINELQQANEKEKTLDAAEPVPAVENGEAKDEPESTPCDSGEASVIIQLGATIGELQNQLADLREQHEKDMDRVKKDAEEEIEDLKKQLSESDDKMNDQNLQQRIQDLEQVIKAQEESYANEIEILNQHFQAELRQAFSGDNASMDLLTRNQELEMELDTVRKNCDNKVKQLEEAHEKEKTQIKDDMATVLQASLASSFGGDYDNYESSNESSNAATEELEERVYKLQQEIEDLEQKYKDDLECERKAHQTEMEDTIRDMMMVRNATNRYDPSDEDECDKTDAAPKSGSNEELEKLKAAHEEELEKLRVEHENEVQQVRSDFTLVISSLRMSNSSGEIIDLHGKINTSDHEKEEMKKAHAKEIEVLKKEKAKLDSEKFFAMRRTEELGGKIYNMQIENEELERKLASYEEGDENHSVSNCMRENCELRDKMKTLESELEEVRNEQENKIESIIMELQDKKREEIEEMTDKVLKLESLIDEMKESHIKELKALEKIDREEEIEALQIEKERIKELETMYDTLKVEYEEEIEELGSEHKKEVEKLRVFYEKEMGEMKKRLAAEEPSRKASVDHNALIKKAVNEQKEIHEKEVSRIKAKHSSEKELLEKQHQSDINDIRMQYDEKLKMGYKEGLRRQSITERKSDGTRMRQLIGERDALQTKLLEQEIKYDTDINVKCEMISNLERLLENAKNAKSNNDNNNSSSKNNSKNNSNNNNNNNNSGTNTKSVPSTSVTVNEDEIQKKIKENQEQIERFQRRIEYYRDKSAREKTEESHRVAELQSEILELRREVENLTNESRKKKEPAKENPHKKDNATKLNPRKVEGAPLRRYTDSVTVKFGRKREMDPRKRWSNLEETSEKEDNKSGSVLARKTLWENKSIDETKYSG